MRKKTFSLILSGILPIIALSFTAFANGGDTAGRPVTPPSATDVIGQIGSSCCLPRKTQKVGNHGISRNKAG